MLLGESSGRQQLSRCLRCRLEIWTRDQILILRSKLDELMPLDHPARFVAEFDDALGRDSKIGAKAWRDVGTHWERRPMTLVRY